MLMGAASNGGPFALPMPISAPPGDFAQSQDCEADYSSRDGFCAARTSLYLVASSGNTSYFPHRCRDRSGDRRSQGGVKVPTGGMVLIRGRRARERRLLREAGQQIR